MNNRLKTYFLIICSVLVTSFYAQAGYIISGKITDTNGSALPNVIVEQVGNSIKTITDFAGNFTVNADELPVELSFYLIGYEPDKSVITKEQDDLVVVLEKSELQNVAFGEQSKENVTASVYSISGEELLSSRSANLFIALQGRLPGLNIIQNDGEPGKESFGILVRGYDSPNSNPVMYVVDGVERSPAGIDLYEVESVTVLKDAAAVAMYGMRGGGGVLLITTKKGMEGKTKITGSIDHSIQSPTRLPNMVSAFDHANMYNQRLANDTLYSDMQSIAMGGTGIDHRGTEFYTPYELERYRLADNTQFYPVRNMVNEFMKDYSKLTHVNVNIQGGSTLMRYFTSVGYAGQDGLFENEPFDKYSYDAKSKASRFNFRTNLDISLNRTLNAWLNIGGYMEKINAPYANGVGWNNLIKKLYETPNNAHNNLTPDGEVIIKRDKLSFATLRSIYGDLNRTGSQSENNTCLNSTFGIRQKLDKVLPGLSASAQFAFDVYSTNNQIRSRSYEAYEVATLSDVNGADSLGFVKVAGTSNSTLTDIQKTYFYYMYDFRASVDYNRVLNNRHYLTGMLMAERHMQQKQALLPTNYLGIGGRFTYAFANRYFAEANFSWQGSEQFRKGNRFGLFPSLSIGWILTNEKFLENKKALTFLKLRASAGQAGNSGFVYGSENQYLYLDTWDTNATQVQLGNPNIKWETFTKYNVGIEARLFSTLTFEGDLFYNKNTDIIIYNNAIIPTGMMGLGGASLPPINLGEVTNKGFEFVLGYTRQINREFSLNMNGNVSFSRNEQGPMGELPYDETYAYPFTREGYPIGYHWGYRTSGIFNSQLEIDDWADQSALGGLPIPGDIKYVDLTGDGKVDIKDRAPLTIGAMPEVTFGFKAQASYKWLDLSLFFNGASRRNVYIQGSGWWSNNDNFTEYMKNAWTPEKAAAGQKILYPRLGKESTNFIKSDYWIADGSYLRLRNIELGFTLPEKVSKMISANAIRFYANGFNLLVWDKLPNDDFDPESANASTTNYPLLKSCNFGVSVKF